MVVAFFIQKDNLLLKTTGDIILVNTTNKSNLATSLSISSKPVAINPYSIVLEYLGDVYILMVNSFGERASLLKRVNAYQKLKQTSPVITITKSIIFVCWMSELQDSDGYGIFATYFDLQGNLLSEEFQVNGEAISNQINPSIDSDDLEDIIIVWYSEYSKRIKYLFTL